MKELTEAAQKALSIFGLNGTPQTGWISWVHETEEGGNHCKICIALGDCWFLASKTPKQPLHPGCHCKKKGIDDPIPGFNTYAECDERKFKNYALIFLPKDDKSGWFSKYGYGIMDADYLIQQYIRQAVINYAAGEYELAKQPTEYGQRIEIVITLPDKIKGGKVEIISIWMVEPNGKIRLITPITES